MKVKRGFLYWQFVVVKFVNSVKASNKFNVTNIITNVFQGSTVFPGF